MTSPENSGLSCPCFNRSFIGISEYCLVFSEVCEEKNYTRNDWTGLLCHILGGFRMNWTSGRKNSPKPV